ncbi:hypothetical protein EB061_03660 [bacterium]|nr:hypothetical protein [bacterium]
MTTLIPISGKPAELDLNQIKSIADADRVLAWLHDVLADMDQQVKDKGTADQAWLMKLRSAQRNTSSLRHRILELRENLDEKSTYHEIAVNVVIHSLTRDQLSELDIKIWERAPHLRGLSLKALR